MDTEVKRFVIEEGFLVFQVVAAIVVGLLLPKAGVVEIIVWAAVLMVLVIVLPFAKYQVERTFKLDYETRAEQLQRERDQLQDKLRQELDGTGATFVQKRIVDEMMESLSDLLRECVRELKESNDVRTTPGVELDQQARVELSARRKDFVKQTTRRVLDGICTALNHRDDPREEVRDVRATFFRYINEDGHEWLKRYAYHYPPAISPQTTGFSFEDAHHRKAAVIRCFSAEDMVIVPDVKEAFERGEMWAEMRQEQHMDYGSMVCYPVITGVPRTPERRFVGVMSITSRQVGFFSHDPHATPLPKSVLTNLLHPFAIFLGILSEMEREDQLDLSLFEQLNTYRTGS